MRGIKPSKDTHFINSDWEARFLIPRCVDDLNKDPRNWRAMVNLGNAHYTIGDVEIALDWFEKAYKLQPDNAVVCSNLGICLAEFARFEEAFPYIEKANKLDPTDQYAASVYAEFLLRIGQWRMGWDLYERCRFSIPQCPLPRYTGGSLEGMRVLVIQEGGAGDVFCFFRFFKNLKELNPASITYALDQDLHCIFENHAWIDKLLPNHDTKITLADYDCYMSSFNMAAIFAPQLAALKFTGNYLAVERDTPKVIGSSPRVGLCWQAGETDENRRHRVLSKANVRNLLEKNPQVRWYSLQKDEPVPEGMYPLNLSTWETTAEEIDALDLVISVDTGVMHLAGSIGKPVWTLLSNSCWRFLLKGTRCVWYPSMRLFRNDTRGYDTAVSAVCEALEKVTKGASIGA